MEGRQRSDRWTVGAGKADRCFQLGHWRLGWWKVVGDTRPTKRGESYLIASSGGTSQFQQTSASLYF